MNLTRHTTVDKKYIFKILICSVFLMWVLSIKGKAQDTITLKDGSEIKAKVTEVNSSEVKYKKWNNLDGPVFVIDKTTVFMIKYQNGGKDVINPIQQPSQAPAQQPPQPNKPTAPYIVAQAAGFVGVKFYDGSGHRMPGEIGWESFKKVPEAYDIAKKAKTTEIVSATILLTGSVLIVADLATHGFNSIGPLGYSGLGVMLVGWCLEPTKKLKKASKIYNSAMHSSVMIGGAPHGIGLTYNF
ncbi:MAG TPA: hypothetical protein VNS58_29430 [Puia sp.]|nr:hypothetical protein [Puia sp.]